MFDVNFEVHNLFGVSNKTMQYTIEYDFIKHYVVVLLIYKCCLCFYVLDL